jgi:hypothetical protein
MGGNLQDPKDSAHFDHGKGKKGNSPLWTGISPAEIERREALISQDFAIDLKNTSAVATTKQVILTKTSPCALAEAQVVLSKQWGWTISPIHGDVDIFYQVYGVIRRGSLDTNFDDDSVPLNFLAARGELNASVRGIIAKALNLDQWSASQPPDDNPVQGKGNSECWGDETRQDLSCRALTDNFLMGMRGATKAEVVKAMNVSGREMDKGRLHFISNYSRGERWGSGVANFVFDQTGRVSIIFANIDGPDGTHVDFIWNRDLLPAGCSDLPGTSMKHCN